MPAGLRVALRSVCISAGRVRVSGVREKTAREEYLSFYSALGNVLTLTISRKERGFVPCSLEARRRE